MAIGDLKDILHKIKVKLYPNYLHHTEGLYIARTDSEATLSVEDVCTTLKNRGGFQGKYDELVDNIHQFFDELVYQVLDGYAVSTRYFSIHTNIGGTFNSDKEAHDHNKHKISFRFRTLKPLIELSRTINVEILGVADVGGYIDEYIDYDTNTTNSVFASNSLFTIHGHKIKVAGDDPACGVFFVPVDNPAKAVKVTRISDNTGNKISGVTPPVQGQNIKIEIRTQYGGSGTMLKSPRVITSGFTMEQC